MPEGGRITRDRLPGRPGLHRSYRLLILVTDVGPMLCDNTHPSGSRGSGADRQYRHGGHTARGGVHTAHLARGIRRRTVDQSRGERVPPILEKNPVGRAAWGIAMGVRDHLLGSIGEYTIVTSQEDASGEALKFLLDAPARLPDRPVGVGETWTSRWTGGRRSKKSGGVFQFRQVARIQEISTTDPRRARITFETTANLDSLPNVSGQSEEMQLDATGADSLGPVHRLGGRKRVIWNDNLGRDGCRGEAAVQGRGKPRTEGKLIPAARVPCVETEPQTNPSLRGYGASRFRPCIPLRNRMVDT